jgi:hypothetical protein
MKTSEESQLDAQMFALGGLGLGQEGRVSKMGYWASFGFCLSLDRALFCSEVFLISVLFSRGW